jgi:hypothetical protein
MNSGSGEADLVGPSALPRPTLVGLRKSRFVGDEPRAVPGLDFNLVAVAIAELFLAVLEREPRLSFGMTDSCFIKERPKVGACERQVNTVESE